MLFTGSSAYHPPQAPQAGGPARVTRGLGSGSLPTPSARRLGHSVWPHKKPPDLQGGSSDRRAVLSLGCLLFSCCSVQTTPPYLLGWRRRGRSRPGCRKAAAEPAFLPCRPPFRGLPHRLLHFPSLRPLFLSLPGFSPRRHLRGFLGGATQLASYGWFCSERQSSPRLSRRLPIA